MGRNRQLAHAIAIVILAGSAAHAANTVFSTDIVDGQVRAGDIQKNAVSGTKVRDDSLTGDDIDVRRRAAR
jgi:hypothetical protein